MPFRAQKTAGMRYYFENPAYSYSDAILLHCMLRHVRPKRIIEIGSGFSSCATLDTNEIFFDNAIATTFIEPFPALLLSLITEEDRKRITIIPRRLQDVDLAEFAQLEAGDILFIDSTHVSKVNSDVNRIFSRYCRRCSRASISIFTTSFILSNIKGNGYSPEDSGTRCICCAPSFNTTTPFASS